MITIKRIYEPAIQEDGFRILVDRLWPRGISKDEAKIDFWLKEIAPSDQLRKWFGHDPKKWPIFKKKYLKELEKNYESLKKLKEILKKYQKITLIYSASDPDHNNAQVLLEFIKNIIDVK